MARRHPLFEEKSKIVFSGPEPGTLIHYFVDETTDEAGGAKTEIPGRGALINRISEFLHLRLQESGIATYFIKRLNMREQVIHDTDAWPIEICVRNAATGEFAEEFDFKNGERLPESLIEYYHVGSQGRRRMITPEHLSMFDWACPEDVKELDHLARRANDFLSGIFAASGLLLASVKLRFGCLWFDDDIKIVIADELSPETCELLPASYVRNFKGLDTHDVIASKVANADYYLTLARRLGILI